MHKIFLLFAFVFLYATVAFGQAAVDIPFLVTDGSANIQMAVGLDLTATDSLDPDLGEADLPPIPPAGVFDIRFDLLPYTGVALSTFKDYRAPGDPPAFPFSGTIQHTLWYQTSAFGIDININYDIPVNAQMTITDQIGGSFLNIGPFEGTGTATIPGSYTAVFSKAYLVMTYNEILPVELTSFSAMVTDQNVILNWKTATELNNQGFEIQRKSSDSEFQKIGYIQGAGTTSETQFYSYTDVNIETGNYTYRLKQIDYDGSFNYSNEVNVAVNFTPEQYSLFQNYPNPFNPSTNIKFQIPEPGDVSIKIYNMLGQEIRTLFSEQVGAGFHTVSWDGRNNSGNQMSSGTYIYRIVAGDFVQTKQMILIK